ncbi:hypothetical protein RRG50_02245 [Mycoplasmopsis felis]|uniref:hypothetical protein n=1 Tax=Mycoplasmopsis felis TaxID=33923 RepID=UPI002AFE8B69|nr:hypothetical protein [Mycoplasmopsis felis]WQQ10587.1 hypothetical protein RRG45_02345 [Mycoplasmopsis felis]
MSKFSKNNKLLFLLGISPISTVSLISCVNSIKEFSYDNIEIVFESEYKLSFLLKKFPNFPDDKLNVNQFVLNENKTPARIRKNELGIILEYENLFPATEYKFTKFSLSNFRLNLNSAKNSFLTKGIRFLNFKINEVNSDNAKLTFNFAVNSEFTNNTFSVDFGRVSYHRYGNGSEDLEIDETTREYFVRTFDFNKESNEVILNNLLPDTLYTIHNIRYSNIVEGINQNENSSFLTPKAQEIKKIDFLNITPNNATVVLEVDKINENESYTLEISKNQEAPFKQNYFRIQNNKIYFDISNLTPDTIYYLKNIYYNHIPFNLNKISKTINFRTLKQPNNQIEEPKNPPIKNPDSNISSNETPVQPAEIRILNQDIFSNISSNSVNLNLEFNQNVSNKIIINYSESNNLHQINSGYTISNNRLFYSLNNLKPNTNYTINSISINNQNIDINHLNKSFTTLNQITNSETINYDLMDSFSNYESLVAKFKPQTQLNIRNIKKMDIGIKKGLLFEFNNLSNDKYKDFSFNYNNKIYKTKYDGNSKYLIVQVDDNESNDISNINYNNQIVNFNSSIESLAKTSSNNSVIVNSIFSVGNDLLISVSGNLNNNDKYLITFKPDINAYRSDITLQGIVQNNQIKITNGLEKFDYSFNKYYLTDTFDLQGHKYLQVNQNISLDLNINNLNPTITKVQFAKKQGVYNTFLGSINVNLNDNDLKQLKEKYFKLTFVDTFQESIPKDTPEQQRVYNRSTGYDWEPRSQRVENNKYVYLNFDELKMFEFKNLTPGIQWKLRTIEIVHKHNLRPVTTFDINNINLLGSKILFEDINISNIVFQDAIGSSFTNHTNTGSSITTVSEMFNKQKDGNDYKLINKTGNLDFNYTNYVNLNKFYLKELQKKYHLFQEGDYGYPKTAKEDTINYSLGNVNYNYGTIIENYAQKEFQESLDKTTYIIKKKLNNFKNLNPDKEAIINFNFFASSNNINLSYWTNNQNAYGISFSYNKLNNSPNKTIDNIKIDFIQNWEELYKALFLGFENNKQARPTLTDQQLQDLINQRIKAKVSIINDELVIELKARTGVINKDIYIHNLSQTPSTFIEKAQNYTSIMYIDDNETDKFSYVNEVQHKNNYLRLDGFLFDRKNEFKSINHEEQIKFDAMEWRTTTHLNDDQILNEVVKKSFGSNYGTVWLIGKVKPSDPNDYEFYVGTNRHVPLSYSETTISPKDHVDKNDVSTYWLPRNSINLKTQFEWEATKSFKLDGTPVYGTNSTKRSEADLQIFKINIKELVDYYNANINSNNKTDKFYMAKHLNEWMTLKPNKISKKGRYIKGQSFVTLYASSFPGPRVSGARNIQARFNYFAGIINEGSDVDKGVTDIYTVMRTFKDTRSGDANQLGSGSSGTGFYDDEGNIYGIHIGLGGLFSGGFILNSQRMNFMGELNDYNENSFAYKLQRNNRLWPSKYELPDIFTEFEKPFEKE